MKLRYLGTLDKTKYYINVDESDGFRLIYRSYGNGLGLIIKPPQRIKEAAREIVKKYLQTV